MTTMPSSFQSLAAENWKERRPKEELALGVTREIYLLERVLQIKAVLPGVCNVCKSIINKVKSKLAGDKNRDDIAAKLASICHRFRIFKGICNNLVNKYKKTVIDALVSDVDATVLCKKLRLCK
ncbi:antimicrobial peptide NK-lysin isoform X2 [Salmo trutta]|uniref:antimicrobial peptide NK-lysin isoform X2 n=1 Tax=Salmo trutta TaxID=8032 RepID=UPI00113226A3|nr:antimicrobial peptide NK-lysin-like isoform X2 [Salmo trutta]